jgi:hypothetical protein
MFGEFEGEIGGDAVEVGLELADAGEGGLYVGEHVLRAYVVEEVGAGDDVLGLVAGAAEEEGSAGFMEAGVELLEGVEAGGVEGGHVAQAEDDDVAEGVEVAGGFGQLFGGAEEEGAVDAEDADVGGNLFVLKDMRLAVAEIFGGDGATVVVAATR